MNWLTWRAVLDPRIPDGLADVRYRWRFADLHDYLIARDAVDDVTPEAD